MSVRITYDAFDDSVVVEEENETKGQKGGEAKKQMQDVTDELQIVELDEETE